ncbi:MAG: hypothetical protein APR54_12630 [Candidatus Cloacimonas sp. SDB]|nr:MAG: hypothetical protein APR54_12630 [Candidatus Cloacimonas sp. SDB]
MITIIGAVLVLGILITVHEAGHFIAARLNGVVVEKFSLGFGPKIISFNKWDVDFRISLIPLGGYLKMKGENPGEETDGIGSFGTKKWWQRAIIAFSGPFANFLLALFIFIFSFLIGRNYEDFNPVVGKINSEDLTELEVNDRILALNSNEITTWTQLTRYTEPEENNKLLVERDDNLLEILLPPLEPQVWLTEILPEAPAVIGEVTPGYSAYKAGLMTGDRILEVDGTEVDNWYEMRELITGSPNETVELKIQREDQIFNKIMKLEENVLDENRIIGIIQHMPLNFRETYSITESIENGVITTASFIILNYITLYKLILKPGAIKQNIGGPVMIFSMTQQSAEKGIDTVLAFIAAISLILMIMNLLPIPILDGGHIFFCFIEGIFKKPLSLKVQTILQNIGFIILISLMIFAFFNDFSKIFTRSESINQQKNILEGN